MTGSTARTRTVTGRCVFVPNPCTTQPCLPGMAYALLGDDGELLFITRGGHWSDQPPRVGGLTLQVGDRLALTGGVSEHQDAFGRPYRLIEAATASRDDPGLTR
jgi:hypothetical protein